MCELLSGFRITAPDLTPNVGLYWYFFTEMFEQFRPFFTYVFLINICIYSIPLSTKLRLVQLHKLCQPEDRAACELH